MFACKRGSFINTGRKEVILYYMCEYFVLIFLLTSISLICSSSEIETAGLRKGSFVKA